MKKLVFSKEKCMEEISSRNKWAKHAYSWTFRHGWMDSCEGLTEEQMEENGYETKPSWMVEVDA